MKTPRKKTEARVWIFVILAVAVAVAIVAAIQAGRLAQQGSGLSQDYQLDLSALAEVDPNLILYTERGGPIKTGLSQAHALVVDAQGTMFVAGDQAIHVIAPSGDIRPIPLPVSPRCLAVTADRYWVGSQDQVLEVNVQGKVLRTWPSLGERAVITAIAVNDQTVYLADAGQRTVGCYDHQGNLLRRIGDKDAERDILGFSVPSPYFDLSLAPDGLLRVINPGNHRIEAYTDQGDLEQWWGAFGNTIDTFTGCCNPISLAILPDGRTVTCEKGVIRVKVYEPDGSFLGVVASMKQLTESAPMVCETPAQCQSGGFDVAVDDAGRVYVLDTLQNVIRIFVENPSS